MKEKIQEILEKGIVDKVFPGAVVGILDNEKRSVVSVGRFTYEEESPKVTDQTLYDTASITKAVPVALLAHHFFEKGLISPQDKVSRFIPELSGERAEKGVIKDLLTYTYILKKNSDPNFSYEHQTSEDILNFVFTGEFQHEPGTHYQYSNIPALLLGIILERVSGKSLYDLSSEIILEPLQMNNSTFSVSDKRQCPPTEVVSWRDVVQGEVHDETAYIMQKTGYHPGCAGLFSTADDLLNVVEMLIQRGVFRGRRLFEENSVKLMHTNMLEDIGQSCGPGWELNQPRFMGNFSHGEMFGKTGFTGTSYIIDPLQGKGLVMLSNRTYPKRSDATGINQVRCGVADVFFRS